MSTFSTDLTLDQQQTLVAAIKSDLGDRPFDAVMIAAEFKLYPNVKATIEAILPGRRWRLRGSRTLAFRHILTELAKKYFVPIDQSYWRVKGEAP